MIARWEFCAGVMRHLNHRFLAGGFLADPHGRTHCGPAGVWYNAGGCLRLGWGSERWMLLMILATAFQLGPSLKNKVLGGENGDVTRQGDHRDRGDLGDR